MLSLDTERSSPTEIRRAIKILVALQDSSEDIRGIIREMYDILAAKVNEERREFRNLNRKSKAPKEPCKKQDGLAKGGGSFQGVELGY